MVIGPNHMGTSEAISGGGMDDLFSVAGKTAVVTGGSRGIGLMIARGLVAGGGGGGGRGAGLCQLAEGGGVRTGRRGAGGGWGVRGGAGGPVVGGGVPGV